MTLIGAVFGPPHERPLLSKMTTTGQGDPTPPTICDLPRMADPAALVEPDPLKALLKE